MAAAGNLMPTGRPYITNEVVITGKDKAVNHLIFASASKGYRLCVKGHQIGPIAGGNLACVTPSSPRTTGNHGIQNMAACRCS
jgi:hypothetical protein